MGRCSRKRNARKKNVISGTMPDDVKALYQWMSFKAPVIGLSSVSLNNFKDTGRGLMARKAINCGDLIISVSSEYFLTTSSITKSPLKSLIARFGIKISPMEALSLFLLYEKSLGKKSEWFPYLEVLPKSFSLPVMWTDDELQSLPHWILVKVNEQKGCITRSYQKLKSLLLKTGDEFGDTFTLDDFLWAWAVITSRSAYMPQPWEDWLDHEPNNYVLIPFLDMFNHTPSASVAAGFNPSSKCYEIRTNVAYKKFKQVFINYGNHDNVELLLSYGFVCTKNPFDSMNFTLDEVVAATKHACCLRGNSNNKLKFIIKNDFCKNMLISYEGISWSLSSTIKILSSLKEIKGELNHHHFHFLEEVIDWKIIEKVIQYLVSNFKQLSSNSKIFSFNNFLANQLCLGFQEIIAEVLNSRGS